MDVTPVSSASFLLSLCWSRSVCTSISPSSITCPLSCVEPYTSCEAFKSTIHSNPSSSTKPPLRLNQFALEDDVLYVLELDPVRAWRDSGIMLLKSTFIGGRQPQSIAILISRHVNIPSSTLDAVVNEYSLFIPRMHNNHERSLTGQIGNLISAKLN